MLLLGDSDSKSRKAFTGKNTEIKREILLSVFYFLQCIHLLIGEPAFS